MRWLIAILLLAGCSAPHSSQKELQAEQAAFVTAVTTPITPWIELGWNYTPDRWPTPQLLWESPTPSGPWILVNVGTPCDDTGTNFCARASRTNSRAFYRASSQWK